MRRNSKECAVENFAGSVDELVERNQSYASNFIDKDLESPPKRKLAIVACMDARVDVSAALGLQNGEAHVIRNAGGVVTDDVIRSLCLSQRFLGTREIVLIHHSRCGLRGLDEPQLRNELAKEVGVMPHWSFDSFDDPYEDVRQSIERLRLNPFVPHKEHISGFVYNVETGLLEAVEK